jgi:hypothetical protein
MPTECAFCPSTAKLSGEHVFSDWMNALLPGPKRFQDIIKKRHWAESKLNWKAKVVCEPCNNGWMSEIEWLNAKPSMAELIVGKVDIPIPQSRARAIAIFAFKTTAVIEHMNRTRTARFFSRSVRHRFRQTLEIPPTVNMWMAGYLPLGQGRCTTIYHELPKADSLELYVCTYAIGHFVFQVVAERKPSSWALSPITGFEHLAVPFWPRVPSGFMWPAEAVLKTVKDFELFAARWQRLHVRKPFGD